MGITFIFLAAILGFRFCTANVSSSPTTSGRDENSGKKFFEILSSSHNEETSHNGTHTVTIYTTTKKTNTNGTISSHTETTYVINNKGNITTYTVKEP